jgi:hypothetical protein
LFRKEVQVTWDVTSCQLRNNYHFREMCCLLVPGTHTGVPEPEERGSINLQNISNYFSFNAV